MLTLTQTAVDVVRELTASSSVDEDGGLRIAVGEPTPEGTPLTLSVVDGPEGSDQTIDLDGAHVYLEQPVAIFLDDKVLDAQVVEEGIRFEFSEQGGGDPRLDGTAPAQ